MASLFNGQSLTLKYLFKAHFEDGTAIQQTPEDKSLFDEKRSAFFDVLEYEKKSRLIKFSLTDGKNEYSVDLITGVFSVNGVEFEACEQNFYPTEPLRIVYFRENRVEQNVVTATREVIEQKFYVNKYYIGWQTTVQGKNHQVAIGIKGE